MVFDLSNKDKKNEYYIINQKQWIELMRVIYPFWFKNNEENSLLFKTKCDNTR